MTAANCAQEWVHKATKRLTLSEVAFSTSSGDSRCMSPFRKDFILPRVFPAISQKTFGGQFKLINRNGGWFHVLAQHVLRLANFKMSCESRWEWEAARQWETREIWVDGTHLQHKSGTFSWLLRMHVRDDAKLFLRLIQHSMLQHFFFRTFYHLFGFQFHRFHYSRLFWFFYSRFLFLASNSTV